METANVANSLCVIPGQIAFAEGTTNSNLMTLGNNGNFWRLVKCKLKYNCLSSKITGGS